MQVAPDIYLAKVPIPDNPLGYLNAYLAKSEEGCLLVDTGWNTDEAFGALARQLGDLGVSFTDLKYIVITHIHPDHFGLVGRLVKHTSAKTVIHEIERGFIESRYVDYDQLLDEMDQWLRINGVPDADRPTLQRASLEVIDRVAVVQADTMVRGGEHIRLGNFDFEVIWTPGHAPGHICLYEHKRRVLISGDHILPGITPNISMHRQSFGNPLTDYLDSLDAVERLEVDIVLPAHEQVFHDLRKRIKEIREHHETRKRQMAEAIGGQRKTAFQIAGLIPWETMGVPWDELKPIYKRSAVTETLAHLEQMRSEGILTKTSKDGVIWYDLAKRRVDVEQ